MNSDGTFIIIKSGVDSKKNLVESKVDSQQIIQARKNAVEHILIGLYEFINLIIKHFMDLSCFIEGDY